jgi:hypothetical protein
MDQRWQIGCCAVVAAKVADAACCRLAAQVVEDTQKGYHISGLSSQVAKSPEELRACFNTGRANRDTRVGGCCSAW